MMSQYYHNILDVFCSSDDICVSARPRGDVSDGQEHRETVHTVPQPPDVPDGRHDRGEQVPVDVSCQRILPEGVGELLADGHAVTV